MALEIDENDDGHDALDTELMRWMPPPPEPDGVSYAMTVLQNHAEGAPMKMKISMLAIDLAKGGFQVCAVGPDGSFPSNRAMSRPRLAPLLAGEPACVVAMEACATSSWPAPVGWSGQLAILAALLDRAEAGLGASGLDDASDGALPAPRVRELLDGMSRGATHEDVLSASIL